MLCACAEPQFLTYDADDTGQSADAALAQTDAGTDAGSHDDAAADTSAPCEDKLAVLGAECPGVVWCPDRGPCDQSDKICCASALNADCSARDNCGLEQQLRCDGPEDCRQGKVCCIYDGATLCSDAQDCDENVRACHSDADCTLNHCTRGLPGTFGGLPVTYLADWGFCRAP
jgi:hypothetical protein